MNVRFVLRQYLKMGAQNLFLPLVYRCCRKNKIEKNKVIFADAHHRELPFSMKALYEALLQTDARVIPMFADYGRDSFLQSLKHMVFFMKEYANAEYVILCDNFLPAASCAKRSETKVIQLWHACGALKKFGKDTPEDIPEYYRGNVMRNCDYVTVSSPFCVPHFAGAMGLPQERMLPVGISRTDLYYRAEYTEEMRRKFCRLYPQAADKKIVLWAPTFRGNAAMARVCGEEAVDRMARRLGEEWFVLKSLHPHLLKKGEEKLAMTTEELLPVTDVLITDYSSVLFDFLLYRKPVVRFAPDLAEYETARGFYMDYGELPGTLVTDGKDLYEAVIKEYENCDRAAIEQTVAKYLGACDGHATERILSLMRDEGKQ